MRHIKKVIVHCTDSDDSLDIGYKEIDEWHRPVSYTHLTLPTNREV
mgnify:CR=1 FL=1